MKREPITNRKIHKDNPYKEELDGMIMASKTRHKAVSVIDPDTGERVTVILEKDYIPFPFAKIYQNKELVNNLSAPACKVLIYILSTIQFHQQKMKLNPELVDIERRTYSKTIIELIMKRILIKEKREWYWLNPMLIFMGTLNYIKDEATNPS